MEMNLKTRYESMRRWITDGRRPVPALPPADSEEAIVTCYNCGHSYIGNYCPVCGQSAKTSKLKLKTILDEALPDIWNLDNRLVRTVVELVTRPGHMVRNYIIDRRRRGYYSPISLLFLLVAAYVVIEHLVFGAHSHLTIDDSTTIDLGSQTLNNAVLKLRSVFIWCSENMAWVTLVMVLAILYPVKWCFKSTPVGREMNMTEFFYLLVYMACQNEIFSFLFLPICYFRGETPGMNVGFSFVLGVWLFKQFFQISWIQSFRRYLRAYILMTAVPLAIIITIGILYEDF